MPCRALSAPWKVPRHLSGIKDSMGQGLGSLPGCSAALLCMGHVGGSPSARGMSQDSQPEKGKGVKAALVLCNTSSLQKDACWCQKTSCIEAG